MAGNYELTDDEAEKLERVLNSMESKRGTYESVNSAGIRTYERGVAEEIVGRPSFSSPRNAIGLGSGEVPRIDAGSGVRK